MQSVRHGAESRSEVYSGNISRSLSETGVAPANLLTPRRAVWMVECAIRMVERAVRLVIRTVWMVIRFVRMVICTLRMIIGHSSLNLDLPYARSYRCFDKFYARNKIQD